MKKLLITIFLAFSAHAETIVGVTETNRKFLINFGEFNTFTYKTHYRYGYGGGQLDIDRNVGINFKSAGGTPVYGITKNIATIAELGNVDINWSSKNSDRDYYTFMPGFGLGYFHLPEPGELEIYAIPRVGLAITNVFSKQFLSPSTTWYTGYHLFLSLAGKMFYSYDFARLNTDHKFKTLTAGFNTSAENKFIIKVAKKQFGQYNERKMSVGFVLTY
jgi:hypothetical protein